MGKFTGVLLASDFDNTLIYTEEALRTRVPVPPLSEKNREAIAYFMEEGGRFAIATGRALPAFLRYADQVPMNAPGIVCNGAAIYDFERQAYLEFSTLGEEVCVEGQQVLDRFPTVAVEAYHIGNTIYGVRPNEITRNHEHLTQVKVVEVALLSETPQPLGKLLFEAQHDTLLEVMGFLEDLGWRSRYEITLSTPTLLEVTAANKGSMVRTLAERLGISMEHVYCAGDESNDISMLTAAAQGFAPANRNPVVDGCGAVIVADAREDAMAEIIAILDRRYSG